jgi:hypothetical protein
VLARPPTYGHVEGTFGELRLSLILRSSNPKSRPFMSATLPNATQGNPEHRKLSKHAGFAIPCTSMKHLTAQSYRDSRSAGRVRSSTLYLVVISRVNSARQRGLGSGPRLTNRNPPKTRFCSNEGVAAQRIDCAHWLYYLDAPLRPAWGCHREGEGALTSPAGAGVVASPKPSASRRRACWVTKRSV